MPAVSRRVFTFAALPVLAAATLVLSGGVLPAQDSPAAPPTHTVARSGLKLSLSREARLESAVRHRLRVDTEAFGGSLDVTEVALRGGAVKKGDLILRFDPGKIDREIESATIALANAQRGHEFAQQEMSILSEGNAVRVERATAAKTAAEHAFEIFDKYEGTKMVRSSELRVQQQEFSLADQKEELAQLEKMYGGTNLASETKEIVLERSKRSIRMAEEWLQFSRQDLTVMREFTYPDRKQQVERDLRWASIELEHTLLNVKMAEANKRAQVEQSAVALRDARERVEKLQRDRERFDLKAPVDGVMTAVTLQPGDSIGARQVLAEIVDPARLQATFHAQPEDLRVLTLGTRVRVTLPAYPEVSLEGEVTDIATVGQPSGGGTVFPVTVKVSGSHPLVRVGLHCSIAAERMVADALTIPARSVLTKNGKSTCHVLVNGKPEPREIVLGARQDDMVQVVSGLRDGDKVLLEAPKE